MLSQIIRSLTYLVEPLGIIWLALWIGAFLLWRNKLRRLALGSAAVALFMFVIGCTSVPGRLLATLEEPFVIESLESIPECDAVVMLGGGVRPSKHEAFGLDLTAAGDRMVMAVELVRRGKAPNLVLGGGAHRVNEQERVEADLMKRWLETWNIVQAPIFSLGGCANTRDEAVRTAALAREQGWKRVVLVTSAYHMRRARAVFLTEGVSVVCVPSDFQTEVSVETEDSIQLVPRHAGFYKMSLFFHEHIGWAMYRKRGWIQPEKI